MRESYRQRVEKMFGSAAAQDLDGFQARSRLRDMVAKEGDGGFICGVIFQEDHFETEEAVLSYCRKSGLDVKATQRYPTGNWGMVTKGSEAYGIVGLTTVALGEGVVAMVANSRSSCMKAASQPDAVTLIGVAARQACLKYGEGIEAYLWDEHNNKERFDGTSYHNAPPGEREVIAEPASESKDDPKPGPGAAVAKRQEVEKGELGLMVALMLPIEAASALAIPGGEPAETMHVTLGYLGKRKNLPADVFERVRSAVVEVCAAFGPVVGSIGGLGRFNASPSSDGRDVFYASFNATLLPALRQAIVEAIDKTGVEVKANHGYSPHVTIAYIDQADPLPVGRLDTRTFSIDAISIVSGNVEREDIPLSGRRVLKADTRNPKEQVHDFYARGVPTAAQAAAGHVPRARQPWSRIVPIVKTDLAKHIVIGPVYVPFDPDDPDTIDTQGHAATAEEIELMAYRFMERHDSGERIDVQHNKAFGGYGRVVESYVAKPGDPVFVPGTWVLGVRVLVDSVWQRILDGKITGFSLDGDTVLEEPSPAAVA